MEKVHEIANDFCEWQRSLMRKANVYSDVPYSHTFKLVPDRKNNCDLVDGMTFNGFKGFINYEITNEELISAFKVLAEADFFHGVMLAEKNIYVFRKEALDYYHSYFAYYKSKNIK